MPKDPILDAHFVQGRCFEIGGGYAPASVRDQMIRGYLVADRMEQQGLIGEHPKKTLLVVGAGPAGLTAAIRAAQLNVKVTVVDARPHHAFLLSGCRSRDIEPTLYDWPVGHWPFAVFPVAGAHMDLSWRAGRADMIALDWQRRLGGILTSHSSITIHMGTKVSSIKHPGSQSGSASSLPQVRVVFGTGTPGSIPTAYGGLISCVGLGDEKCSLATYSGFRFWETDPYERSNCGISNPPQILISGGGDGGLQDFIRCATQGGAAAAFRVILKALIGSPHLINMMTSAIDNAEDVATRALSWNLASHDEPVFRRLEAAHLSVIAQLKSSPLEWTAICSALRNLIPNPTPKIDLIHRGDYFTQCYALNRFLALLILEVLVDDPNIRRMKQTEITSIVGFGHVCANSPAACHGKDHQVTLRTTGAAIVTPHRSYQVIILRHGVLGPKSIFPTMKPSRPRQMLPYFVDT